MSKNGYCDYCKMAYEVISLRKIEEKMVCCYCYNLMKDLPLFLRYQEGLIFVESELSKLGYWLETLH